jgi:hypothetical protein
MTETSVWSGDEKHTDYNVISKKLFDIASLAMSVSRLTD